MAIIQKHLNSEVAAGGEIVIDLPFSPDIYDQAAARLCSVSAEVSMYSGAYSLTWGGGSVVVKNTGSLWPKDSDIFLYLPDVINGDYIGIGDYTPVANRSCLISNRYPFIGRDGRHDGPAQLRQYASVSSGTVTFYHPSITSSETISHGGTTSVSVIAGAVVIGAGTCWEIRDSAGHFWTHCAALSTTSVVMWDVSGLGDHLIAEGLAEAVVTALCSTSRDLTIGTDWLDRGFTLADGNQCVDDAGQYLLPSGTVIPSLESGLTAASWSWKFNAVFVDTRRLYLDGSAVFLGD